MKLEVVHETRYRYTGPIAETAMELRLRPMDGNGQRCLKFDLDASADIEPRTYRDGYVNEVHYSNMARPHTTLNVSSPKVVATGPRSDNEHRPDPVHDSFS